VLSFTEIFLVVAEIGLQVPTYPRIRTTKLFNLIVLRLFMDQSSQNFPHF